MPANGRKLDSWNSIIHYIWFSKRKEMFGTKTNTCSLAVIFRINLIENLMFQFGSFKSLLIYVLTTFGFIISIFQVKEVMKSKNEIMACLITTLFYVLINVLTYFTILHCQFSLEANRGLAMIKKMSLVLISIWTLFLYDYYSENSLKAFYYLPLMGILILQLLRINFGRSK